MSDDDTELPDDEGWTEQDAAEVQAKFKFGNVSELDLRAMRRQFHEMTDRQTFLELKARGVGSSMAAYEVGWSDRKLAAVLAEPEFADLVASIEERKNETAEHVLYLKMVAGNMDALKMWMFNRSPERWRDVRRIEVTHDATPDMKRALEGAAMVRELIRSEGIAALQPGGHLDVVDAEVVSDSDDDGGSV